VPASGYILTDLLNEVALDDRESMPELIQVVYPELRRLASSLMRTEYHRQTLQTTALVHEAFLRLFDGSIPDWDNRLHFFSCAARQMRRILVDHARRRNAGKRGNGGRPLTLSEIDAETPALFERTILLDDAVERLASIDPRAAQIVEMRFFSGLAHEEIAAVFGLHARTAESDWKFARAWLRRALSPPA
jgi:RNA polymerase sigma factor (TIGR02999 family)